MRHWQQLVLAAGFCGLTAWSASAQTLTEEQALARMRTEHPQVRLLQLTVREVEAAARERGLLANPTVSFTREDAGFGVDDFLLVTQELPMRGRVGLFGEAAEQAVDAAEARADADLLAFETRLRLAFADLLLAQERTSARVTALAELTQLVDVLRTREQEGEGSLFDRLRAEREVADIETDLGTVTIDRLTAQARLASFFAPGVDPARLTAMGSLTDGGTISGLDVLVAQAVAGRSDYRALARSDAQWAIERRAAERLRLPGAAVTAGLKRTGAPTARNSGYAVTANVAVPLFNRGQAQVARADAARGRIDAERQALRIRIESEVRVAHAAASRYRALADTYRLGSVEQAAELASIATAGYEEGEYGILELLDAHRVTLGVELRLLELSAAARRAAIELDRATGMETTP
jgi:cobalt-zinc-cadmium efflux system outer membrane protein